MSDPCYIVVIKCLDCETIEEVDSVWKLKTDAQERTRKIDLNDKDMRRLSDIIETVVI
jgi:hypothetical protein